MKLNLLVYLVVRERIERSVKPRINPATRKLIGSNGVILALINAKINAGR